MDKLDITTVPKQVLDAMNGDEDYTEKYEKVLPLVSRYLQNLDSDQIKSIAQTLCRMS